VAKSSAGIGTGQLTALPSYTAPIGWEGFADTSQQIHPAITAFNFDKSSIGVPTTDYGLQHQNKINEI